MAVVRFRGVTKRFGAVRAVDDVSFETNDGEFLCLLGPSGCGKTTTLRLVAGLERPTEGTIEIGESDVTRQSPKDRDVGMVFQDYALYPHMSVRDNIAYPLKVRHAGVQDRAERAKSVAESLQIGKLLDRLPGQISGGEQQRTSVARAVVHEPRVFLFDEPLSNLDAKLRLESRSFLRHLQKELGVTAIYVTHDQAEAMALADRIAVMESGNIIQLGTPLEVYRRPRTTFVAKFLGSPPMNLFDVTYSGGRFEGTSFSIDASPWRASEMLEEGDAVSLGVRPEHLRIGDTEDSEAIPGELYATEVLGPETLVTLAIDGGRVVSRVFGDDPPEVATQSYLHFRKEHVHVFSKEGERVERE